MYMKFPFYVSYTRRDKGLIKIHATLSAVGRKLYDSLHIKAATRAYQVQQNEDAPETVSSP